jgi:hypothetical protein
MHPVFKKLNLKEEQILLIMNAPKSFLPAMAEVDDSITIDRGPIRERYGFVLIFAEQAAAIQAAATVLSKKLSEDAKLWIAYPKKSSKKYQSDISRDHGWQPLGDLGYEGVRQIAIDEDWSALRFRHVDYIKTMKRSKNLAMSKKGKERTE